MTSSPTASGTSSWRARSPVGEHPRDGDRSVRSGAGLFECDYWK